jgi:hypothetical protein
MEYKKFKDKIVNLQSELDQFRVEFLDRDEFKSFVDNLSDRIGGYNEICITGYFSEAVRKSLETLTRPYGRKLRLISQEFDTNKARDSKNLEVMRKLCEAGAEIKINNRLHARFLIAYNKLERGSVGVLVIGSFDFNTEGVSKERYDAGIQTVNPDLIASALKLFEEIWTDPESIPLLEKYPTKRTAQT